MEEDKEVNENESIIICAISKLFIQVCIYD